MSDQTTIQPETAEIIRAALSSAQAGRVNEAIQIVTDRLKAGANDTALHAILGALLLSAQKSAEALPHLRRANADRPDDPLIARNLARALIACEEYGAVLDLVSDALAARDPRGELLHSRAFAAQATNDFASASKDYEQIVARFSGDWEAWNNLGNARLAGGDLSGAIEALSRAATLNPGATETRFNLVMALRDARKFKLAEAELRRMAADFPADPVPRFNLFLLLQMQGLDISARTELEAAVALDPDDAEKLVTMGQLQLLTFDYAGARASFEKALTFEPSNGSAFLGIADAHEHSDPSPLRQLLTRAEAANVEPAYADAIRATIAQRERNYDAALAALSRLPEDFDPVRRWQLEGQTRDSLGDYDGAFKAFTRMNDSMAEQPDRPLQRAAELRSRISRELQQTTAAWRDSWVAPLLQPARPSPVFLVGFPRSGTTLLDTMLMGHPDVQVMEEKPALVRVLHEIGGLDAIAAMTEAEVGRWQARYFELMAEHAPLRDGALLVDKSPLHMQNVAEIYRLFPDARFILALRHPADVVLSCFIAAFRLNSSMSNFLKLETTAEFYDLSFRLWDRAREIFPVKVQTIVYEQLVAGPEAVLRPLVEELGLEWHSQVADHQPTANSRGIIPTASYAQVTQPIYRSAIGRWQRYRKHLEPVLPVLEPWAKKFGYEI